MARKSQKQIPISFGDEFDVQSDFLQLDQIIEDRGSKYTVTGGRVTNRAEAKKFLTELKKDKRFATATHNTWSARIRKDGALFETKTTTAKQELEASSFLNYKNKMSSM